MRRQIRNFEHKDEKATLDVWYRSCKFTYTFLPEWKSISHEEAASVFRNRILACCDIWVAEQCDVVVAFLAMNGSYVDRLYVDPDEIQKGWGTLLMEHAKHLCPTGLELHTHQQNRRARVFYERNGFEVFREIPASCSTQREFQVRRLSAVSDLAESRGAFE